MNKRDAITILSSALGGAFFFLIFLNPENCDLRKSDYIMTAIYAAITTFFIAYTTSGLKNKGSDE